MRRADARLLERVTRQYMRAYMRAAVDGERPTIEEMIALHAALNELADATSAANVRVN